MNRLMHSEYSVQKILIFFISVAWVVETALAVPPPPAQKTAEDVIVESPAVKVVGGEKEKDIFRALQEADFIFTAKIKSIVVHSLGISHASMPLTQVVFKEIQMLKGAFPGQKTFIYANPPEEVKSYRSQKVLVLLRYLDHKKRELRITRIVPATKKTLSLVDVATATQADIEAKQEDDGT